MQKTKMIALVPLKANSTRVPGKNFRLFNGKPLVKWILDTLLSIPQIDYVVINTDARKELKDIGVIDSERVIIRDRKPELCGDEVSMNKILKDDIENYNADIYLMSHTTNPLLTKETITAAVNKFVQFQGMDEADSLFTVFKHQTRFYTDTAEPINHDPNNLIPTQELDPYFEENSNLYIFTRESFAKSEARIGLKPTMFEVSKMEGVDIDTQEDWDVAEAIAKSLAARVKD